MLVRSPAFWPHRKHKNASHIDPLSTASILATYFIHPVDLLHIRRTVFNMSTVAAKKIENPLLSRYPSQPAPASQPSRPLEPATHHNVPRTSSALSSNPPPRRSYDDGLAFPLAEPELKSTSTANAATVVSAPKPVYNTSGCWVRVLGISTSDQLDDAMKHLNTYGSIKQRLGNISPTSNIIFLQYSSPFEAMTASASTFIQLTSYFYLAVQRLEDSDPVLQRLLAGNPSDNIWGVPRKAAEEKKDLSIDETDIFLSPPPKKETPQRVFFESLLCWFLSITD